MADKPEGRVRDKASAAAETSKAVAGTNAPAQGYPLWRAAFTRSEGGPPTSRQRLTDWFEGI